MKVLLGVDLGTSAFKAVAITTDGRMLASQRVAAAYDRPGRGRVQFSAPRRFQQLSRLLRRLIRTLPSDARPAALALSGASGNTLLLDGRHRPLAPAISWLDTRAGDDFTALLPGVTRDQVRQVVGWPWSCRFSLTQLAWLRRHRQALYRQARYVAPDTAYYHHRLTGRFAIDHSSATNFFLEDQLSGRWHEPFLRALNLERTAVPDLVAPASRIGVLTASAARSAGLPAGLPVVAGAFDHPSAALGAGVMKPGDLLLSCGTSWVGFFPTPDRKAPLAAGVLVDRFLQPAGPWGAMFSLTAVGTTVDRYLTEVFPLRRSLSLAERYEQCLAEAADVPRGTEGGPIDPLRPFPESAAEKARLCAGASVGQLTRRLMVGVALALRRRLLGVTAHGFRFRRVTMVGGPSANAAWVQIVADVLQREIFVAGGSATGAVGAALLGGVGVGCYCSAAEAAGSMRPAHTRVAPDHAAYAWYDQFDWR